MRSNVQPDCQCCGGKISQAQIQEYHEQMLDEMEAGVTWSVTAFNNIALKKMGIVNRVHDFVTIACPKCPEGGRAARLVTSETNPPSMFEKDQVIGLPESEDEKEPQSLVEHLQQVLPGDIITIATKLKGTRFDIQHINSVQLGALLDTLCDRAIEAAELLQKG